MIERVNEANSHEAMAYLKQHENSSLFLLGNAETYGWNLADSPYSGNYKLMRKGSKVIGVFCLYRCGSLMVQSQESDFDSILDACRRRRSPSKAAWATGSIALRYGPICKAGNGLRLKRFAQKRSCIPSNLPNGKQRPPRPGYCKRPIILFGKT